MLRGGRRPGRMEVEVVDRPQRVDSRTSVPAAQQSMLTEQTPPKMFCRVWAKLLGRKSGTTCHQSL